MSLLVQNMKNINSIKFQDHSSDSNKIMQLEEELKALKQKLQQVTSQEGYPANMISELQNQNRTFLVDKADSALEKGSEMYAFSLDHLQELTQFLSCLLSNKTVRELIDESTMSMIQSFINKSTEMTNSGRRSLQSLNLLMTSNGVMPESKPTTATQTDDVTEDQLTIKKLKSRLEDIEPINKFLAAENDEYENRVKDLNNKVKSLNDEITQIEATDRNDGAFSAR